MPTYSNQAPSNSVPSLSREFVVRRISEGESGRLKEELKCEACGKGYKHISSLAKHLWEHTPEWNVTKKLLISKHQQVQLLEAASILVGMNENQSRRNSVLHDDSAIEDMKYSSSLPSYSNNACPPSKTGSVSGSNTNENISPLGNASHPNFKHRLPQSMSTFNMNSCTDNEDISFRRSNSISHNPPSTELNEIKSPVITGGYLDTKEDQFADLGQFKRTGSVIGVSGNLEDNPRSLPEKEQSDKASSEHSMPNSEDSEYESVIGKME